MSGSEFYFREGNKDDAPDIVGLFQVVFGKFQTIEEWRWRFLEGPVKKLLISLALDRSGNIVAHYALHPTWMVYKGQKILGAQSLGTMVHKDFRGKGLFVETAKRCYQLAQSNGVKLLYGSPNEKSYPGFVNKLGWTETVELSPLYYILNLRKLIQSRVSNLFGRLLLLPPLTVWLEYKKRRNSVYPDVPAPVSVYQISEFDESFDFLWQECKSQFSVGVWKDSSYLQWRYVRIPRQKCKILKASNGTKTMGFMATTHVMENGLYVGIILDVLACEPVELTTKALIEAALSIFEASGTDMVKVFFLKNSRYWKIFRSAGFSYFSQKVSRPLSNRWRVLVTTQRQKFMPSGIWLLAI